MPLCVSVSRAARRDIRDMTQTQAENGNTDLRLGKSPRLGRRWQILSVFVCLFTGLPTVYCIMEGAGGETREDNYDVRLSFTRSEERSATESNQEETFLEKYTRMWNVEPQKIQEAQTFLAEESKKYGCIDVKDEEALLFLHVKNVFHDPRPVDKTFLAALAVDPKQHPIHVHYEWLINPDLAPNAMEPTPDALRERYTAARKRLLKLLATEGDISDSRTPDDVQSFESALEQLPDEWSSPDTSYIFHRDAPVVKNRKNPNTVLCQRRQHSGLCYMHSAYVLHHYLLSMAQENEDTDKRAAMVNLISFMRCSPSFSAQKLKDHIFDNKGGCSLAALQDLLLPRSKTLSYGFQHVTSQTFNKFGPGLVSSFTVLSEFRDGTNLVFHGDPVGEEVGQHAMVLIGVRPTSNEDNPAFLLQNWWDRKQFVETDLEYLEGSNTALSFVKTPQTKVRENLQLTFDYYAESENLDTGETCDEREYL